MLIRVEQGKVKKDRYTILSQKLLEDLRSYWRKYRPVKWLFPSQKPKNHLSTVSVHKAFTLAKKAGINKGPGIHTLRHYAEFRIMPSLLEAAM